MEVRVTDNPASEAVIGIDLGGTKICGALVDRSGKILAERRVDTEPTRGAVQILQKMIHHANELGALAESEGRDVCAIGIGSPGCINAETGTVLSPAFNIPGWQGTKMAATLREATGLAAFAGNDGNVAALGEMMFGAAKGVRDMLLITLGTGIGGGLILGGKVHHGRGFLAGEFGHIVIDWRGRPCACGSIGCIEAYASGPGIAMTAREKLHGGVRSNILERGASPEAVTAEAVANAAKEDDAIALEVIHDTGRYLGIALANVINLLDLQMIVIGGAVSKIGEKLFSQVRAEVKARVIPGTGQQVKIVGARLGEKAGVIGAAALAWEGTSQL